MNILTNIDLELINGGSWTDGALTTFGAQLASDGLGYAESSNPMVATMGIFVAATGGWAWAFGSAFDGIASLFD